MVESPYSAKFKYASLCIGEPGSWFKEALTKLSYSGGAKIKGKTSISTGIEKLVVSAIKGLIPNEILYRKKTRGFSQPSSVWYRNELKDFVHDTLFSQDSLCLDYVNKQYMHKLYTEHTSGQANFDYLLNSLLIFELWLKAFVK